MQAFLRLLSRADPDASLVCAAREGSSRAFDALVHRYQERLALFVRARLDAAIDADDVAQEIFVAAWRELPRFRGASRFKTWLFAIALNHCAEARRRHHRLKLILGDLDEQAEPLAAQCGQNGSDPLEHSLVTADREAVRAHLARLPDSERQALELYYYAELNLPEIARLLDVNLSTLKYRFYQAHRRLRSRLAENPADELQREWFGRKRP